MFRWIYGCVLHKERNSDCEKQLGNIHTLIILYVAHLSHLSESDVKLKQELKLTSLCPYLDLSNFNSGKVAMARQPGQSSWG